MPTGLPGTKAPHGTVARYIAHGCRCGDCLDAHRAYYGKRSRGQYLTDIEAPHGTVGRYRRCRCDECKAAAATAQRVYRDARKVPCSHGCGTMVLHQRRDPAKPPECHPCSLRRIAAERAA